VLDDLLYDIRHQPAGKECRILYLNFWLYFMAVVIFLSSLKHNYLFFACKEQNKNKCLQSEQK